MSRRASQPEVKKDDATGKWWFQIDAPALPGGKRRRIHRSGFVTRSEAQAVMRDLLEEQAEVPASRRFTVKEMVDYYLAGCTHRAINTQNQYKWSLGKLTKEFGTRPAASLTREDLEDWLEELVLAPRSKHTIIKQMRAAWKYAIDDHLLTANPASRVPLPSVDPTAKFWTEEQVVAWVMKAGEMLPCVGMAHVAVDSALRRGELTGLLWSDVDFEAGTIKVEKQLRVDSSTGRATIGPLKRARRHPKVTLHPDSVAALHARREQQDAHRALMTVWPDTDYIWTWPDGRPFDPNWWTRTFNDVAAAAELPEYGPHVLRHSYAAAALRAGVDIGVVSMRLGHASERVTRDLYGHLLPAQDRDVAETMGNLLLPKAV